MATAPSSSQHGACPPDLPWRGAPDYFLSFLENQPAAQLWSRGAQSLFETPIGNFSYSSPEYGGDNSITPFLGSPSDWLAGLGLDEGVDKGLRSMSSRLHSGWTFNGQPLPGP